MKNTTAWSITFCLIAALSCLTLKWALAFSRETGSGITITFTEGYGIFAWQVGLIASLHTILAGFMFATAGIKQIAVWASLSAFIGAALLLLLFNLYAYTIGWSWPRYPGPWVNLLSTLGLLALTSIDLRVALRSKK